MSEFRLEIITPEREFFDGLVEAAICPTADGDVEILKGHQMMVAAIKEDVIKIKVDGVFKDAVISDGFFEVRPDEVIVFAQYCDWQEDFESARALREKESEREKERYEKSLAEQKINFFSLAKILMDGKKKNRRSINM